MSTAWAPAVYHFCEWCHEEAVEEGVRFCDDCDFYRRAGFMASPDDVGLAGFHVKPGSGGEALRPHPPVTSYDRVIWTCLGLTVIEILILWGSLWHISGFWSWVQSFSW